MVVAMFFPENASFIEMMVHPLWKFDSRNITDLIYSWFNVTEGIAWLAIALYVFRRYLVHQKTNLEIIYTLLFIVFGISDFWESYIVQLWLIMTKGLIFAGIIIVRFRLVRKHYAGYRF